VEEPEENQLSLFGARVYQTGEKDGGGQARFFFQFNHFFRQNSHLYL
jgi:hypothetical protein